MAISMLNSLRTILLTIAFTCCAFKYSQQSKQQVVESKISSIETKMKELKDAGKISSGEFYDAKDVLMPLHYPILFDPWLLRFNGYVGSGCIIAFSLLGFVRWGKKGNEVAE